MIFTTATAHPDLTALDRRFAADGVVRLAGLLSGDECRAIRQRLDDYAAHRLPNLPTGDYTLEADGQTVRNLWRLQLHDPFFADFAARADFAALVAPLIHGEPVVWGVETFNKPARIGSVVPYHQDNAYFCFAPPDVLTLWIALDRVTEENGAVEYLIGSHRELLPHVPSGVKGNSYGLPPAFDDAPWTAAKAFLAPGDAVLHHGQTIHRSAPNRSDQARLSLVIVYRAAHARRDEALWADYQAALAKTPQGG